jgi:outer membrane protein assembly factor BamB
VTGPGRRSVVAGLSLLLATGLAVSGCGSSSNAASACSAKPAKAVAASGPLPPATGKPAAGWTMPGANLQNTRDVASAITGSDVARLGVAWTVPLKTSAHTDGAYATTPVVVNGVVYVQDLLSDVMAISLATGHVLWRHDYNSPNGGPDGVNVAGGTVYAATNHAAVALDAATGRQLWSRTLIGNDHEGIDMTPGYDHGTVYVSTVPVNPTVGEYLGGGKATLWALNAATGAPKWSWDEVQDLWGHPDINSGGGQWYAPSFDAQGNVYIGVANPAPLFGTKSYPLGSSRPGPDLYTDSVVKLSPQGRLLWYYQLTPHDLYDWDLQDPPVLTTVNGRPVVIDGGKAGILIELDAQTGQLLWKRPVGGHSGPANGGLLSEHATTAARAGLPAKFCLEPSIYGGVETQLASNGATTFAAVNDLALPGTPAGYTGTVTSVVAAVEHAAGEMVAVSQDTGQVEWDTPLPSSPYGAATVTNDVVFTTTFHGDLYALDAGTGKVLLKTPMSAGSNAPVAVDGDYVIAGAGTPLTATQHPMIIAYKLGAAGKLPETVGS